MEIILPLFILAGGYIVSNTDNPNSNPNQKRRLERGLEEGYENLNNTKILPNTNTLPQNYPVSNLEELVDTVGKYENPNTVTDKYFNQSLYENKERDGANISNNIQNVYSLTGNYLDTKEFTHKNMVPFNSGKIENKTFNYAMGENILDNMVGTGSQVQKKIEQAPLFAPQSDMQFANGAPNMSDFYQSRVNPGKNNAMVKPFESEHVGPGLGQRGGTQGSGGYNSGMEARDSWLPPTVDELRVSTNPKLEYSLEGHQGPSYSHVQNVGIEGKVEKYRPDTYFINSQDRYFTTTGQEKGQALRPIEEVYDTIRGDVSVSYSGVAGGDKNASYVQKNYTAPKRVILENCDIGISTATRKGDSTDTENLMRSHTNYANNRSTSRQPDTYRSSFRGSVGAIIAPLMDVFRPTKKEEYGNNVRIYGDSGSLVNSSYVLNYNDTTKVTIRDTTLFSPDSYIGNQNAKSNGYLSNPQQAIFNQRDTTNCAYSGSSGGSGTRTGDVLTDKYKIQTNNELKEPSTVARTNHGTSQIYNQTMNVNVARIDSDRDNNRLWQPQSTTISQMGPSKINVGSMKSKQQYNDCKIGVDYISPDLLDAFRSNPYTHSLTSAV
jgi:hypothetical protein